MNPSRCPDETSLLQAHRATGLDESARWHVATCPDCAAAIAVDDALRIAAAAFAEPADPAAARALLLRARFEARCRQAERSLAPLVVWQRVVAVATAGGLAAAVLRFVAAGPETAGPAAQPLTILLAAGLAGLALVPICFLVRDQI